MYFTLFQCFISLFTICHSEVWLDQCNGDVRSANHGQRQQQNAMVMGNFENRRIWQSCFSCINKVNKDIESQGCSSSTFAVLSTCKCNSEVKTSVDHACKCTQSLSQYGLLVEVIFAPFMTFVALILSLFLVCHRKRKRPRGFRRSRKRKRARRVQMSPPGFIPRPPPAPRAMQRPPMGPMSPPNIRR